MAMEEAAAMAAPQEVQALKRNVRGGKYQQETYRDSPRTAQKRRL